MGEGIENNDKGKCKPITLSGEREGQVRITGATGGGQNRTQRKMIEGELRLYKLSSRLQEERIRRKKK